MSASPAEGAAAVVDEHGYGGIYAAAAVYDGFYRGRGKPFRAEAELVANLVRHHCPAARSLLDLGCGTGLHLEFLAADLAHVEGVDLSEEMLAIAAARLPGTRLHVGDMRTFAVGRRFDAVICLNSTVGYLGDTAQLDACLRRVAAHLEPGGVAVVEPWWFPETFLPGYIAGDVVDGDGGRVIARVSHSVRDGSRTRMDVHYVVADPGVGTRHFTDTHMLTLFDRSDYERAFTRAGMSVEFRRSDGPLPRLFVGVLGEGTR